VPFLLVAVTVSLASFDSIMALEQRWPRTIFAVYHFSAPAADVLAVIPILP
jgi:hypothetical protein